MSSSNPPKPRSLKRLSQKRTVAPHRPSLAAIPGALRPSAACCTICARRTSPAPSVRERAMRASSSASPSPKARIRIVIGRLPHRPAAGLNAPDHEKSQITWRMHHLALHPLSCCDIWHGGDPGAARGAVPPPAAPEEGVLVLVPVRGGTLDGLFDLGPGLEASALQRQGAHDLPPGLDQVQVGRVLGLEDELPARMEHAEQKHVRRAVGIEVVDHCIDALARRIDPGLDRAQEIDPIGRRAALIGLGEGLAAGRLEGAENIAGDTAAAVIDLLPGPCGLGTRRPDELPARMALGLLRSHLVQADDYAASRRRRVELFDRPLFFAKSGSTRAPNQVSSWRQRRPSRMKISLIRLRRMAMPCSDR